METRAKDMLQKSLDPQRIGEPYFQRMEALGIPKFKYLAQVYGSMIWGVQKGLGITWYIPVGGSFGRVSSYGQFSGTYTDFDQMMKMDASLPVGVSKIGGLPDIDPLWGFEWPMAEPSEDGEGDAVKV